VFETFTRRVRMRSLTSRNHSNNKNNTLCHIILNVCRIDTFLQNLSGVRTNKYICPRVDCTNNNQRGAFSLRFYFLTSPTRCTSYNSTETNTADTYYNRHTYRSTVGERYDSEEMSCVIYFHNIYDNRTNT